MAAQDRGRRRRLRAQRHVGQIDFGFKLHQFPDKVRRRARPGRAIGELPGIFTRVGDELFQRLPRRVAFHHRGVRAAGRKRQGREVFHRKSGVLVDDRYDQHRRRRYENRVAIGRRVPGGLDADGAASSRLIDHDHLLAQDCRHFRRNDARDDIGHRAGRKRIDDLDGFCRVVGGVRRRRGQDATYHEESGGYCSSARLTKPRQQVHDVTSNDGIALSANRLAHGVSNQSRFCLTRSLIVFTREQRGRTFAATAIMKPRNIIEVLAWEPKPGHSGFLPG